MFLQNSTLSKEPDALYPPNPSPPHKNADSIAVLNHTTVKETHVTGLRMAQLVELYMVPQKEENEDVLSFN